MSAPNPTDRDALAAGDAYFGTCQLIHDFIGETVRPIVNRETNVLIWTRTCNGMITRVHGWLRTLGKLGHPGDFQAILAGTRALFEIAVDFVLLKSEEQGNFTKLLDWEESEKLRWARRLSSKAPEKHAFAAQFARDNETRIKELRRKHWGDTKHRPRWTGRDLGQDAEKAEQFGLAAKQAGQLSAEGFVEFYTERYSPGCWNVHGSGLIGLRDAPREMLPMIVAQGFRDAAHFSLIASKFVLDFMGKYDDLAKVRFEQLEDDLQLARGRIVRDHKMQSLGT